MTLQEMLDALVVETRMEVYRAQLLRRLQEAIRGLHSAALFSRDKRSAITDTSGLTSQKFSLPFPENCTKLAVIRPVASEGGPLTLTTHNDCYTPIEDESLLNGIDGSPLIDYYHAKDTAVYIYSSIIPPKIFMSWYQLPDTTDMSLQTWLMERHPQAIMDWALARFWRVNGKENIASQIERTLYSVDIPNIINTYATEEEL